GAIGGGAGGAGGGGIPPRDGAGKNPPADIPVLWRLAQAGPAQPPLLIAGQRTHRQDSWSKRQSSRIANAVRSRLLHDHTPDTGCGLKLFPRALYLDLPYFDHMHRFLPALVLREGGVVRSVAVDHLPRHTGVSKYGVFDRLWVGIVDLFGVAWLLRRHAQRILVEPESREIGRQAENAAQRDTVERVL